MVVVQARTGGWLISGFRPGAPSLRLAHHRLPSPQLGYSVRCWWVLKVTWIATVAKQAWRESLRKTWVCPIVRLTHPPPLQLLVGRLQDTTTALSPLRLHLALPRLRTPLGHGGQDAFAPPCGDHCDQCEGPGKATIGERWTSVAKQTKGLTRDRCCFWLDCFWDTFL